MSTTGVYEKGNSILELRGIETNRQDVLRRIQPYFAQIDSFKKRVKTKKIGICTEFIYKSNIFNQLEFQYRRYGYKNANKYFYVIKRSTLRI